MASSTARTRDGLARLIKKAGGQAELAIVLNVSRQAVHDWIVRGLIPLSRVEEICELFPKTFAPKDLRPDIFNGDISALEKIILTVGSVSGLAALLDVEPSLVSKWTHGQRKITPHYVRRLCAIAKNQNMREDIQPHHLRPDIYGDADAGPRPSVV